MPEEINQGQVDNAFTNAAQAAPPAPAPETNAPAPSSAPSGQTQGNSLFERAKGAGLQLDGITSDSDLASAVLDAYINDRPFAQYGRQGLYQQPAAQAQPEPEPEPEEAEFDEGKFFSEAWSIPELSPGAQWALKAGAFEENEQGMMVPVAGREQAAYPYVKEINDYQQARARLNESFAANPVKFLAEKLEPYFRHKFSSQWQELSNQSLQTFEQQSFVDKFKAENASWLYTPDGSAYTEHGKKFSGIVDTYMGKGLSLQDAVEIAKAMAPPPQKQEQAPQQAGAERQRDSQGRYLPAGTPAPVAPPPTKQESFLEKSRKQVMANASHAGGAKPSSTQVANEGDLENMFVVAADRAFATS